MKKLFSKQFVFLVLGLLPISFAAAQTTQPAEPAEVAVEKTTVERKPYDPWTSKTMTGDWGGVRTDLEDIGIRIGLSYQQQYQQNFRGGLSTNNGHRFSGTYDFETEFDFEKMKLIDGGSFYIKAKGGYSDGINPDKVGALGNVNSDAFEDYSVFVRKWWYKQKLLDDKVEFRIGRIQTNKDLFDTGLYAYHEDRDFINTSMIRNPLIPHSTSLGAFLKVQPIDWFYFQAAGYDIQAVRRTRTGFDTAFHDQAWFAGLWEFGFTPKWDSCKGPMPGHYRIGWWYDPRVETVFENTLGGRTRPSHRGDDVGMYLGVDQMVWKENDNPKDQQGLGMFSRFGIAHKDINRISHYWSIGASYKGLIPTRDNDVTAFGVAQSILSRQYRDEVHSDASRETVYEWYYQIQVTPWFTISPDFQVVTNPGGDKNDRDAIVGGIRFRIVF